MQKCRVKYLCELYVNNSHSKTRLSLRNNRSTKTAEYQLTEQQKGDKRDTLDRS